jgi:hypothetical protein
MRCYGTGPRFVRRGASVFYDLRDLDEWLGSLPRFTSTSDPGQDNSRHGA